MFSSVAKKFRKEHICKESFGKIVLEFRHWRAFLGKMPRMQKNLGPHLMIDLGPKYVAVPNRGKLSVNR